MVYICVPVHDEGRTIGPLLWKIRKVMADFGRDYEILVLDDASRDETPDVLQRYRKTLPMRVIRSDERLGYARATERLLREAVRSAPYPKRDSVVTLQGDFSEDPAQIVELVKTLEGGADIVAGCASSAGPSAPRGVRIMRRAAPWVVGRSWGRAPVSDPLCGLRVYRVIVLSKAFRTEEGDVALLSASEPLAVNLELLGLVAPHARRIEEAPATGRYDLQVRASRARPLKTLRELLRHRGRAWLQDAGEAA
ncbi:MAG: glycosyltransferase family 2 protein [Gemmatimonadetes bacterium]|nr:glycosyltransferase family 2 protein [Gemmatimonadota bacterium]